jgi:formimidoylglutamate deiminase
MEYGQRLKLQGRNICAAPSLGQPSTAQRLFQAAHAGGASAAGFEATGFVVGARADCVVLDTASPALLGVPLAHTLDALIFATDAIGIAQVYVAGERLIDGGVHPQQAAIAQGLIQTMQSLWIKPV